MYPTYGKQDPGEVLWPLCADVNNLLPWGGGGVGGRAEADPH